MNSKGEPNYVSRLRRLVAEGKLPHGVGLHQVNVLHDDWCAIFKGERCNCDPDIQLEVERRTKCTA